VAAADRSSGDHRVVFCFRAGSGTPAGRNIAMAVRRAAGRLARSPAIGHDYAISMIPKKLAPAKAGVADFAPANAGVADFSVKIRRGASPMNLTVAIVGRPNVGKSTLFNRLAGRRLALVDASPGVTRDRREATARLGDLAFTIIDTPGVEDAKAESLTGRMRAQAEAALAAADAVFFLIDASTGVMPDDRTFSNLLRRAGKPTILIANKAESRAGAAGVLDAFALGLGVPVPISAEHGEGLADLYDAMRAALPEKTDDRGQMTEDRGQTANDGRPVTEGTGANDQSPSSSSVLRPPSSVIRLAVVGRPNAGKSTLINRLLGEERLLTGPEPGITRDAVAVPLTLAGRQFLVHDTAGLRRRSRVEGKLEQLSVAGTLEAIRFAEVVILLMDATAAFEEQDLRIADLVEREGRALVIGVNKWDLKEQAIGAISRLRQDADHFLPQVKGVPVVAVSGLSGLGLDRLITAVADIHRLWNHRVPTPALNRFLEAVTAAHPPPAVSGRRLKLNYITQPKARPPSFVLFTSRADAVPEGYRRYLVNALRETFELPGVPIRLTLREKANPYGGGGQRAGRQAPGGKGSGRTGTAKRQWRMFHR
jgi:GTP-binding protein